MDAANFSVRISFLSVGRGGVLSVPQSDIHLVRILIIVMPDQIGHELAVATDRWPKPERTNTTINYSHLDLQLVPMSHRPNVIARYCDFELNKIYTYKQLTA